MGGGYVLDFTDGSFANFFSDLDIDIYDTEMYVGFGASKANRMRAFWKSGSDAEVAKALYAVADYIETKQAVGGLRVEVPVEQIQRIRSIAAALPTGGRVDTAPNGVVITTAATVTSNHISIEIHEDIYDHVRPYLDAGDYFHAVDEAYKVVRDKLRELTGSERASEVFNQGAQNTRHYEALFGKAVPTDAPEADFFRGVGYLHLGVQFLRNEKAHSLAGPVEPNLAVHYLALASLAYDLITRYVSEESIHEVEELVRSKRRSYKSASAFYRQFDNHEWLVGLELPASVSSASVRKTLKVKWLKDADFAQSFDHSNIMLMRLELVADQLTMEDVDHILELPTKDQYGNDQMAGLPQFLDFLDERFPEKLSRKTRVRMDELRGR